MPLLNNLRSSRELLKRLLRRFGLETTKECDKIRLQAAALEAAANGVVITDREARVVWVNPAFLRLTGYTREQVLGKAPSLWSSGKQDQRYYETLWQTILSGKTWQGEIVNRRQDGSLYSEAMTITPVRDHRGAISNFIAIKQDLTELKKAQHEVNEARERYRQMFDNVPVGIFRCTSEGSFLQISPWLARDLGYSSSDEQMASITNLAQLYVDPARYGEFKLRMEQHGILRDFEFEAYKKGTGKAWLVCDARAVAGPQGAIYYDGTLQDITEKKLLAMQVQQAQRMEVLGRLAGGIAHDFNNLLMAISGYTDLILSVAEPNAIVHKYAEQIKKATQRSSGLTKQLLAFSRRQVTAMVAVDLKELLADVSNMLQHLLGAHIAISINTASRPLHVEADRNQLEQIIVNLAVNARDAMPNGGSLRVEAFDVHLADDCNLPPGWYVCFSVTDTGRGIEKELQGKIFEPFFSTKGESGTGLGLATVYGIVTQAKGAIRVQSEVGRGSTFTVYLPLSVKPVTATGVPSVTEAPCGDECVLLVDDEEALRTAIQEYLAAKGYTVLSARHGGEALEIMDSKPGTIRLLITDLTMPGISGAELACRVRDLNPALPIVFMSGYMDGTAHQFVSARPAGTDYIQKPFPLEDLAVKVRRLLDASGASWNPGMDQDGKAAKHLN